MNFYPYSLYVSENSGAIFDENGFLQNEEQNNFTFVSRCRDYAKDGNRISHLETKEIVSFSSMIMLPLGCPEIKPNVLVEVRDKDGNIRLSANVIRFERNQLHCRIWV